MNKVTIAVMEQLRAEIDASHERYLRHAREYGRHALISMAAPVFAENPDLLCIAFETYGSPESGCEIQSGECLMRGILEAYNAVDWKEVLGTPRDRAETIFDMQLFGMGVADLSDHKYLISISPAGAVLDTWLSRHDSAMFRLFPPSYCDSHLVYLYPEGEGISIKSFPPEKPYTFEAES